MSKKIIFITGGLNAPRIIKRIVSFYDAGYDVVVYGFDRQTYKNVNVLPKEIKSINLGYVLDGKNYFKSFFLHRKKLAVIFNDNKHKNVFYYSFGFVPALLVAFYSGRKFAYEIADLTYCNFPNALLRITLKNIDRFIISRSSLTVLTSEGFNKFLYGSKVNAKILVQPNKMNNFYRNFQRTLNPINEDHGISFAFIGGLRYPNTVFRFAKIIGEHFPMHRFLFYGDSSYRNEVVNIASTYNNVFFYGKYRNPEDLIDIYKEVDVTVACYDTTTMNERIAEPNKLYESILFTKPIIVSKGTFLSERVEQLKCGFSIVASNNESIIDFVNTLSVNKLNEIKERLLNIDNSKILDDPTAIFKRLDEIMNN